MASLPNLYRLEDIHSGCVEASETHVARSIE
jgi:hypothetical protein